MTVFKRFARFATCTAVLAVMILPGAAWAKTEIQFWHAMGGQLGETVNELVKQFNQSQGEYEVKPLNTRYARSAPPTR